MEKVEEKSKKVITGFLLYFSPQKLLKENWLKVATFLRPDIALNIFSSNKNRLAKMKCRVAATAHVIRDVHCRSDAASPAQR